MEKGIPQTIGPYQILKTLGEGGFGKVFLVEKEKKHFALKLFEGDFENDENLRWLFEKEFILLKKYSHPHIVKVFDYGQHPKPFFVSEFIDGSPFDQAARTADATQLLSWTSEILRALHFLHQHGLCHRDIKPENILITQQGVKLIDFGLTGLSPAIPAGTPSLMAPELFQGKGYTSASDLYSLGITLARSLNSISSLPSPFRHLIDSLKEKDPEKRPRTLTALTLLFPLLPEKNILKEVQEDFLSSLDHPVFVDADGHYETILKLVKESVSLILEIVGEEGSGRSRLIEELKPPLTVQGFFMTEKENVMLIARQETEINFTKAKKQIFQLTPWKMESVEKFLEPYFSFPISKKDLTLLLEKTKGNPGQIVFWIKALLTRDPSVLFDSSLFSQELKRPLESLLSPQETILQAQKELAVDRAKNALDLLKKINLESLKPDWELRALEIKGEAFLRANQLSEAMALFKERETKANPTFKAYLHERMGLISLRQCHWEEATEFFSRSLEVSSSNEEKVRRENYLAQVFMKQGDLQKAEQIFIKNWKIFETDLKPSEQESITNFNLTALYLQQKKYEETILQGKEELKFYDRLKKKEVLARTGYILGEAFYRLERPTEAENNWKEGCQIALEIRNDELLLRFQNALGNLFFESQKWEEALASYEKALFYAYAQKDFAALCRILINQALIHKKQNHEQQAQSLFEAAKSYLPQITDTHEREELEQVVAKQLSRPALIPIYKKGITMSKNMSENETIESAYRSLLHLSEMLAAEHELRPLLELILRYAIQLSEAERGAILLKEEEKLQVVATHNADPKNILGQISQQIATQVLTEGRPIFTHDAMSDKRFSDNKSILLFNLRSIYCLPIRVLGKTIGVLYLDHTHAADLFSDSDKEILKAYCQQAGLAIENAKLFEHYKQRENQLQEKLSESEQEKDQLAAQIKSEKKGWIGCYTFQAIQTESPQMFRVFELLEPIIDTKLSVMIQGESGTGKELLAKAIHYNSGRKSKPFIATNCGAIPETLLESELFGHKAGAFTGATRDKKGFFESANGGTLFLDEIGELSLAAQVKLLRVLQEGEVLPVGETQPRKVDVRVLTATHRDLKELIRQSKFREDLFYRVCEYSIYLPPLRDRIEDIPLLTKYFIDEYRQENKIRENISPASDLLKKLIASPWPGNIRELRNVVRVGSALRKGKWINLANFPSHYSFLNQDHPLPRPSGASPLPSREGEGGGENFVIYDPTLTLEDYEKIIYAAAFRHFDYKPKNTYQALKVSNATLFKKLKEYDLNDKENPLYQSSFDYHPSMTLNQHLDKILKAAYQHYQQQPYKVIESLKISPGTFYKWKKLNPSTAKPPSPSLGKT